MKGPPLTKKDSQAPGQPATDKENKDIQNALNANVGGLSLIQEMSEQKESGLGATDRKKAGPQKQVGEIDINMI